MSAGLYDPYDPAYDPGSGVSITPDRDADRCCECDDRWQPCGCGCHT